MKEVEKTPNQKIDLQTFAVIYFILFFVSVIFNQSKPYLKFPKLNDSFTETMALDIGIGIVVGSFIVLLSQVLTRMGTFKEINAEFKKLLGPLTNTEIFFIAAFSSLGEEFFFRGLVQGNLGIVFASVLFGLMHTGPGKKYIPWTVFALVMGFVLGGIYEWRDNLIVPIVIHFIVNFGNLYFAMKLYAKENA